MLHKCTDTECPFVGQRTSRHCRCHQTDEQVLRIALERAVAILDGELGSSWSDRNQADWEIIDAALSGGAL